MKLLDRVEEVTCAVLLFFVSALAFANVIVRYLTSTSLAFTEELVVNLFVWITVIGAAIAFRRRAHLNVTALINCFPRRQRKVLAAFSGACGAVLFLILFVQGVGLVAQEYRSGMRTYSMALPMWWFGLAVPLGALLLLLRVVQAAVDDIRRLDGPPR